MPDNSTNSTNQEPTNKENETELKEEVIEEETETTESNLHYEDSVIGALTGVMDENGSE